MLEDSIGVEHIGNAHQSMSATGARGNSKAKLERQEAERVGAKIDKPAGSLLVCYKGAEKDREVEEDRGREWRVKEGHSR